MSELYKEAAALLRKLELRQGGLKSLAYAESTVHKRSSFALVCETLRYKPLLRELLAAVPECHKALKTPKDAKEPPALVFVALYDLLFGRQKIQGGGYVKKALVQHQTSFRAALARLKIKRKVASNEALLPPENRQQHLALPRYVRVNTLLASAEETEAFTREYDAKQDRDVRDLLVLPSGTELHEHEMVKSGKLVLQDKASCFPAFVLHGEHTDAEDEQGDVIDACAAPGNKTSHLAMLLQQQDGDGVDSTTPKRRVFAFDRSLKRLELLKRRMQLAGAATRVQAELQSFLEVPVDDDMYRNVRSILLDPSCSGSGMTNRLDHLLDIASSRDTVLEPEQGAEYEEDTAKRLQSLADFQLEALRKAFSFPQVERVVYSTCSIFQKEDEEVAAAALKSEENIRAARPFVLKPALTSWSRRGLEVAGLSAEQAKALVRANGLEDSTNGFFVAYFERIDRVGGAPAVVNEEAERNTEAATAASVEAPATDNSAESETSHPGKKRKVLSSAQKENRKRRKREKRKKHGNAKPGKENTEDEEE
ncbi:putative 28S rRNA (cytosine-C(5))-methyltransferase [Phytophthora pseudosyringae]|uniref:Putative 28S rRNA (Cytosine-C(5))-methyltransferase n=1 Tax=Phytophthora pseudosyringae TaxID=221518 RepID=A0A8T1W171_9STRA|nr:putative 28S rRNA (cytosine-C(5))-methyltransferase [Phytophthora pseudosyringae]